MPIRSKKLFAPAHAVFAVKACGIQIQDKPKARIIQFTNLYE